MAGANHELVRLPLRDPWSGDVECAAAFGELDGMLIVWTDSFQ